MSSPQIEWFIQQDGSLSPEEQYYTGSYRPGELLSTNICIWNNRWGQESVDNINSAKLAITFDTVEDSFLLGLCKIKINDQEQQPLIIEGQKGYISLGNLSGFANNGSLSDNPDNFCMINLTFGPVPSNLQNGLKNMLLNLEFDSITE